MRTCIPFRQASILKIYDSHFINRRIRTADKFPHAEESRPKITAQSNRAALPNISDGRFRTATVPVGLETENHCLRVQIRVKKKVVKPAGLK